MKAVILSLLAWSAVTVIATDVTLDLGMILPATEPTGTTDPWQCATENLSQYFQMPKPTGTLEEAILDYGEVLFNETCPVTGAAALSCPLPEHSRWCGFSTVVPPELLANYSSYASMALSWWEAHSSTVYELATICPYGWYKAMNNNLSGASWLNVTLAYAQCYAQDAKITPNSAVASPTASSESRTRVEGPEETGITKPNSVSQVKNLQVWVVATTIIVTATITIV